ncbi:putative hydrolase [Mytilinidion resinicola]|uniref:Hydrolase n=1 Tax=Mytilinidion resinicola TaxID=574789 RepID=A0A6A6XZB5_9PEZI|nr:putative hydrolase [Mytilinidion resinicola]KAF2801916.1 putative hydrolase [Mytilinidion resinicola]
MSSSEASPFEEWSCQQVKVEDGTIFLRYDGGGPPPLLLHGVPQHSLMYHTIAPALVCKGFLVIVPDLPGMGQSFHRSSAPLTSKKASDALYTVIKFLRIWQMHIFSYDKGYLVKSLIVAEYALPGFGLEVFQQPSKGKTLFDSWHLGLFTVPEAAVFLIRGREEQFLLRYFWRAAYSGLSAIKPEHFRRYVQEWQRPSGLESAVEFLSGSVLEDTEEFKSVRVKPRMLAMGGEASLHSRELLEQFWGPIGENVLACVVVPKTGHWLGDENPLWVADYISSWINESAGDVSVASLEWLHQKVTLNEDA